MFTEKKQAVNCHASGSYDMTSQVAAAETPYWQCLDTDSVRDQHLQHAAAGPRDWAGGNGVSLVRTITGNIETGMIPVN